MSSSRHTFSTQVTRNKIKFYSRKRGDYLNFILLLIGMLIGIFLGLFIFKKRIMGILKINTIDSNSSPYLFLEIDEKKIDQLSKRKYVVFKVNITRN